MNKLLRPKTSRTRVMSSSKRRTFHRLLLFTLKPSVSLKELILNLIFNLDAKSDEPAYYTNRAIAHLKLDNFQAAMDDCKAALRIDEKFAKAYNRMSKCYIALGNLTEASFALQKSIELEPSN